MSQELSEWADKRDHPEKYEAKKEKQDMTEASEDIESDKK